LHANDTANAVEAFGRAIACNSDAFWVLNGLGLALSQSEQFSESNRTFSSAVLNCEREIKKNPQAYDAHYHLGIALLGKNEAARSFEVFQVALSLCAARGVVLDFISDLQLMPGSQEALAFLSSSLQD
jgi:Tfp pilus assembly protein PilF